jgi:D-glycero-alpha-D-manno-heptose 1-phosphate guanylyltransferase
LTQDQRLVAIILAGGLGTRMRSVTRDCPKPMLLINGKPFLTYLLGFLKSQGVEEIIFSIGYKSKVIEEYFGSQYNDIMITYAVEDQPLGTGGAIRNALRFVDTKQAFIMNGDTFFPIRLSALSDFHESKSSQITLALKFMRGLERYGAVTIDAEGLVTGFHEKRNGDAGFINCGIYLICRELFDDMCLPDNFSFEVDFLRDYCLRKTMYGLPFNDYFIDIGVPHDYERAKVEFARFGNR